MVQLLVLVAGKAKRVYHYSSHILNNRLALSVEREVIMAISDLLEEELGLYKKLVAEQAVRKPADDEQAKCHVDEVVSLGLFVIERIREHDPAVSEAGRPNDYFETSDEEGAHRVRLYETWLSETRKLIERILTLEGSGIVVDHGNELIRAFDRVIFTSLDPERVRQSMKDALDGRVKPLREAADEFRRRRYGRSA